VKAVDERLPVDLLNNSHSLQFRQKVPWEAFINPHAETIVDKAAQEGFLGTRQQVGMKEGVFLCSREGG